MGKIESLRRLATAQKAEAAEAAAPAPERVKVTLRIAQDVYEALVLAKARGAGDMSAQIEALVRAREAGGR